MKTPAWSIKPSGCWPLAESWRLTDYDPGLMMGSEGDPPVVAPGEDLGRSVRMTSSARKSALEHAKLAKGRDKEFAGHEVAVTGAGA